MHENVKFIKCSCCGHQWPINGPNECPKCFPPETKGLKLSHKDMVDEFNKLSGTIHNLKDITYDATLTTIKLATKIIEDLAKTIKNLTTKNKKLKKENDELLEECGSLQHAYIIGWKNGKAGLPCEVKMQYPEVYKYKWVRIEE